MSCSPCYVGSCITAPNNCALGAPGGWQKLWFFNQCDIASYQFESLNGNPRGRVSGLTLVPGAQAYSFAYYKKTGLQFDSEAIDENGFRWTHTVAIPVINRDAETTALLEQMVGAELVFVGLHRDGRYYVAGVGQEGFQLSNWNDTKGRVAADGAVMELRFSLTDIYPQKEVLLNDGSLSMSDLEGRRALTDGFFAAIDCGAGSGPAPIGEFMIFGQTTFESLENSNDSFQLDILVNRSVCTDDITITQTGGNLPSDFVGLSPLIGSGNSSGDVMIFVGNGLTPSEYGLELTFTGALCGSQTQTFVLTVFPEG